MEQEAKILKSQYKIIKNIGQGGFGRTYLAENIKDELKSLCVVKQLETIRKDEAFLQLARKMFKKEAEILARLGIHPQIPSLIDYFEEDGEFYLVEEFIEGESLDKKFENETPWSEEKIYTFLENFLGILDFMHNCGVIHRDIKPENIIYDTTNNRLALVDFGTVKELIMQPNQTPRATVAVGTMGYMPPEQIQGKPEFNSDIYALGMVCLQALTGIHPNDFNKNDDQELTWEEFTNLDPNLKEVFKKMVNDKHKKRYQSAKEIFQDLQKVKNQYKVTEVINNELHNINILTNNYENNNTNLNSNHQKLSNLLTENIGEKEKPESAPSISEAENSSKFNYGTFKPFIFPVVLGLAFTGILYVWKNLETIRSEQRLALISEQIESLYQEEKYEQCYQKVEVPETKQLLSQADVSELSGKCRLGAAEQQASMLNWSQAIEIALEIPENSTSYQKAQDQLNEWGNDLVEEAIKAYEVDGNLNAAIQIINEIPQTLPVKKEGIKLSGLWKEDDTCSQNHLNKARIFMEQNNLQEAKNIASDVVTNSLSLKRREEAKELLKQIEEIDPSLPDVILGIGSLCD